MHSTADPLLNSNVTEIRATALQQQHTMSSPAKPELSGPPDYPHQYPPPPDMVTVNPGYQQGYQQAAYHPGVAAAAAAGREEAGESAEADDAKSDQGYETPGIPKEYLNVSSLMNFANNHY